MFCPMKESLPQASAVTPPYFNQLIDCRMHGRSLAGIRDPNDDRSRLNLEYGFLRHSEMSHKSPVHLRLLTRNVIRSTIEIVQSLSELSFPITFVFQESRDRSLDLTFSCSGRPI